VSFTRALVVVGFALAFCLSGLGLAVYLSREKEKLAVDQVLAEGFGLAVGKAARSPSHRLDLREVAPFRWQRVLLVADGTGKDTISRALGFAWKGELLFSTNDMLVFVDGHSVARYADYRGSRAFAGFRRPIETIDRDHAVFHVRGQVITH
jgi:hypothetical protein